MTTSNKARSLPTLMLALAVLAGGAAAALAPSVAFADGEACTTKKFHYPVVEKACKENGRKGARGVMKEAVKKARAAGKEVKCTSCHEDTKKFVLKDNAVKDLKPWI